MELPTWQTLWKCPILLHSVHILPYTGHCLGRCVPPQYLHGCHCMLLWCINVFVLLSFTLLDILILSNWPDSVNVFNTATWALCTSTLLAHANLSPLVMWSSFFAAVNSLIISFGMHLSFSPCINCSLSFLLTSWYLHSTAATHSLPIHSSTFSSSYLHNFLNWSNLIVSLYGGLNLFVNVSNSPSNVLQVSFSVVVSVSKCWRPFFPTSF